MIDTPPLREQIARLIDPSRWRVLDSYLAEVRRKYAGEDAAYDPDAFKDKASLKIADDIMALLPSLPDGWAGPTYEDACRLSRAFNQSANLRDDQDRRINEWIKTLIQQSQIAALSTQAVGD